MQEKNALAKLWHVASMLINGLRDKLRRDEPVDPFISYLQVKWEIENRRRHKAKRKRSRKLAAARGQDGIARNWKRIV